MKFRALKKNTNTFQQKNWHDSCSSINFYLKPQSPASNSQLIVENMLNAPPKKHILVYRESGTIVTRRK